MSYKTFASTYLLYCRPEEENWGKITADFQKYISTVVSNNGASHEKCRYIQLEVTHSTVFTVTVTNVHTCFMQPGCSCSLAAKGKRPARLEAVDRVEQKQQTCFGFFLSWFSSLGLLVIWFLQTNTLSQTFYPSCPHHSPASITPCTLSTRQSVSLCVFSCINLCYTLDKCLGMRKRAFWMFIFDVFYHPSLQEWTNSTNPMNSAQPCNFIQLLQMWFHDSIFVAFCDFYQSTCRRVTQTS